MSWYNVAWPNRSPVAVDNRAGGNGNADVQIVVPGDWDPFWSIVLATGNDIRVTAADGATPLVFKLLVWNYNNRQATIQIQAAPLTGSAWTQVFLYWGNQAASVGTGSFTASSPKTGLLFLGAPTWPMVTGKAERAGGTRPRTVIAKKSNEKLRVAWDFRYLLHRRLGPHNGSRTLEEIQAVTLVDVQTGGNSQGGMLDQAETRLIDGWVFTFLQAGSAGSEYGAICRVQTTLGNTLELRARISVQDPE